MKGIGARLALLALLAAPSPACRDAQAGSARWPVIGEAPWTVVTVGGDTADVVLSAALNGDADGAYEIEFTVADTTNTSTVYSLYVGVDGGAAAATGSESVTFGGNGAVTFSVAQARLHILDASTVATGQNPHGRIYMQGRRLTGMARMYRAEGWRLTEGATTNVACYITMGQYKTTGNITTLTLHADTAAGFKAGSMVRWRRVPA